MDWMDPLPRKGEEQRRIKREGDGEGPAVTISPTMSHSSARGNPTLIKTLINKAACCKGGRGRGGGGGGSQEQIT